MYPLILDSRLFEKPWGGRKLESILGKPLPAGKVFGRCAEGPKIANGALAGSTLGELIVRLGSQIMGSVAAIDSDFPISVEFIDANGTMPLQVPAAGRTIALYVVQSDAGAAIVRNIAERTTRLSLRESWHGSSSEFGFAADQFVAIPARAGDCHYISAGVPYGVSSPAGGALIASIETAAGSTLVLGEDPADAFLDAIDFSLAAGTLKQRRSHMAGIFTTVSRLLTCPSFTLEKVRMTEGIEEPIPYDQPVVWVMLEGGAELSADGETPPTTIRRGDTALLPAAMKNPRVKTLKDCVWLEATFPVGQGTS